MESLGYVAFALVWVAIGVTAAAVLLGRHGHRSPSWYAIGAVLGPLFIPIAMERRRRKPVLIEPATPYAKQPAAASGGWPATTTGTDPGLRVVAAVDGSAEADGALDSAVRVLGDRIGHLTLVTVLDHDAAESGDDAPRQRASALLQRCAGRAAQTVDDTRVVAGAPADAVLAAADDADADVIVVGRKGSGLSKPVLGSVAATLAASSPRPVLLGGDLAAAAHRSDGG